MTLSRKAAIAGIGATDFTAPLLLEPTGLLLNVASTTALSVQTVGDKPVLTVNTNTAGGTPFYATTTAYGVFTVASTTVTGTSAAPTMRPQIAGGSDVTSSQ